jgi:hypothetical protein
MMAGKQPLEKGEKQSICSKLSGQKHARVVGKILGVHALERRYIMRNGNRCKSTGHNYRQQKPGNERDLKESEDRLRLWRKGPASRRGLLRQGRGHGALRLHGCEAGFKTSTVRGFGG